MSFTQETHTSARTREIERIFQNNREAIQADLESLQLGFRDLAIKWKVNDRNVRRWAERVGVDPIQRSKERRLLKLDNSKCKTKKSKQIEQDEKPQAAEVWRLWR